MKIEVHPDKKRTFMDNFLYPFMFASLILVVWMLIANSPPMYIPSVKWTLIFIILGFSNSYLYARELESTEPVRWWNIFFVVFDFLAAIASSVTGGLYLWAFLLNL